MERGVGKWRAVRGLSRGTVVFYISLVLVDNESLWPENENGDTNEEREKRNRKVEGCLRLSRGIVAFCMSLLMSNLSQRKKRKI